MKQKMMEEVLSAWWEKWLNQKGGEAADNDDKESIEEVGRKRSIAIRDEPETWIEVSSKDEPEAADLAADDDPEDDTAAAPPDVCLDLEAAVLSKVSTRAECSGTTTSALPAYWELTLPIQAPIARYMKDEDSQRSEDAEKFPRVVEHTVTGDEYESYEEQECGL